MSSESPASVIYSEDGYSLAAVNGAAIPTGTRGLIVEGSDGTNSRFIQVDSSGRIVNVGAGTAGTPAGGVLTIQGVSGGTPMPISGTITATNASNGTTGAAAPTTAGEAGAVVVSSAPTYVAGNLQGLTMTTAGALRTDSSATTQPVSGTITANVGTTGGLALDTSVNGLLVAQGSTTSGEKGPLIQGAVTTSAPSYTTAQTSPLSLTTAGLLRIDGVFPTGTATPVDATFVGAAVTTASPTYTTGQMSALSLTTAGALRIDGSATTQPVSGTITANAGTGNFNVIGTGSAGAAASGVVSIQGIAGMTAVAVSGTVTANAGTGNYNNASISSTGAAPPTSATFAGGSVTTAAPTYTTGQMSALSLTTTGSLRVDGSGSTQPVSGTITANAGTGSFTVAQATAANLNATVVGAGTAGTPSGGVVSIQGVAGGKPIAVTTDVSTNATITSVAAATTSTTLIVSNANRVLATIYNDSSSIMYLAIGATASATNFTIKIFPNSYFELPASTTSAISAIWNTAVGNARVTELT
jgi:hypothetical protein